MIRRTGTECTRKTTDRSRLRVSEMSGDIKIDISKYPGETGQTSDCGISD